MSSSATEGELQVGDQVRVRGGSFPGLRTVTGKVHTTDGRLVAVRLDGSMSLFKAGDLELQARAGRVLLRYLVTVECDEHQGELLDLHLTDGGNGLAEGVQLTADRLDLGRVEVTVEGAP